MWRLWHKLFGWDYVLVVGFGTNMVLRTTKDKRGNLYAKFCDELWLLNEDGTARGSIKWTPLTW